MKFFIDAADVDEIRDLAAVLADWEKTGQSIPSPETVAAE